MRGDGEGDGIGEPYPIISGRGTVGGMMGTNWDGIVYETSPMGVVLPGGGEEVTGGWWTWEYAYVGMGLATWE